MKNQREFPGASAYRDRHGKRRWRYREKGFTAQLGTEYGSPDFVRRYEAALNREKVKGGVGQDRTRPGTINALVAAYYTTPEYIDCRDSTKQNVRGVIEGFRREHGYKRVSKIRRRHVMDILAKKAPTPAAANRLLQMIRRLMNLAVALEIRADNPAQGIKKYTIQSGGFHSWSESEIDRFYEVHPLGSMAHLAMTLMLYTGAARGDAVKLGWGNVKNGRISYRRKKTSRKSDIVIDIPIHPNLQAALELLPRDAFTFLQTKHGKSCKPSWLGKLMRKWCDDAGLSECTSHGLRKACARRLAEVGASVHEIAAVTDHASLAEVERYTRAANRSAMVDAGFAKMAENPNREQVVANHPKRFAKKRSK